MSLHKEISFEIEICEHLAAHGWLYAESDAANYDRARALFPADAIAWVQATQPKAWEALDKNHGAQAADVLPGRLRDSINSCGTPDVLRHDMAASGRHCVIFLPVYNVQISQSEERRHENRYVR
jgi:type I restriction enzyme R subunit